MLLYQILASTMHEKDKKSHTVTIKLKYQVQRGMRNLSCLMHQIGNPLLQGYCDPVCVSVFWSIIYIATVVYILYW